jgi:hypothetical protein
MTTAAPSTALATIQPAFTYPERLALAGFLAGHRGRGCSASFGKDADGTFGSVARSLGGSRRTGRAT